MSGSGLFTSRKPVRQHLLLTRGLAGEVADLRNDVAAEMLPLAALTVEGWTNPVAAVTNAIVTSLASAVTAVTLSGTGLTGSVGGGAMTPARNITLTTSNHVATWTGNTVVHGTYNGSAQTDTLAMANSTTIVGTKPFDKVTSVVMDAQVDALGTFTVGFGAAIGVVQVPKTRAGGVILLRENVGGALVTTGALTAAGLYTPGTAPDAAHSYAIYYEYVPSGSSGVGLAAGAGAAGSYTYARHDTWRVPMATAAALKTAIAIGTTQPVTLTTQPDYPRSIRAKTSGAWAATADVVITLTGVDQNGNSATETLTIPANTGTSAAVESTHSVAWAKLTQATFTGPAGWTAGTFELDAGTKFGLLTSSGGVVAVYKEMVATDAAGPPVPANVGTLGTVDTTTNTYVPHTTVDGLTDFDIWYTVTNATVTVHT